MLLRSTLWKEKDVWIILSSLNRLNLIVILSSDWSALKAVLFYQCKNRKIEWNGKKYTFFSYLSLHFVVLAQGFVDKHWAVGAQKRCYWGAKASRLGHNCIVFGRRKHCLCFWVVQTCAVSAFLLLWKAFYLLSLLLPSFDVLRR